MKYPHLTASDIISYMESLRNEKQCVVLMRFFKTGPGQYGEGDEFLGLKVAQTREVVKVAAKDFPLSEVPELLMSKWHEVRLCCMVFHVQTMLMRCFQRQGLAANSSITCTL